MKHTGSSIPKVALNPRATRRGRGDRLFTATHSRLNTHWAAMPMTKRIQGRRTTKELWDILRKAVLDGTFNENNTLVMYCFDPLKYPWH